MDDTLWAQIDRIPGWFTRGEADLYLEYVNGPWCEVGCWQGRSARVLCSTGHPGYVVEWFRGSPEHAADQLGDLTDSTLRTNLAGFEATIVAGDFRDRSVRAQVPTGLQFLHLDADHSYDMTFEAFDLYAPKLATGGFVALHDAWGEDGSHEYTSWPGTMTFAKELATTKGWKHVADNKRAAIFRKDMQ